MDRCHFDGTEAVVRAVNADGTESYIDGADGVPELVQGVPLCSDCLYGRGFDDPSYSIRIIPRGDALSEVERRSAIINAFEAIHSMSLEGGHAVHNRYARGFMLARRHSPDEMKVKSLCINAFVRGVSMRMTPTLQDLHRMPEGVEQFALMGSAIRHEYPHLLTQDRLSLIMAVPFSEFSSPRTPRPGGPAL